MFVGEAPGDLEDRAGHPFVGPAGKLLDRAMLEAGIDRTRVYLTNSVEHFKFVIVLLGATAAQALLADLKRVATYLGRPKAKVAGSR